MPIARTPPFLGRKIAPPPPPQPPPVTIATPTLEPPPTLRVEAPPFDRNRLWATITNLYPDITDFFPVLPNDAQFQEGVNSLISVAQEDMDAFLDDLRARGRNEDISYLLSTLFGASPEEIGDF